MGSFARHAPCFLLYKVKVRNPQSEPGRSEFRVKRGCTRELLRSRGKLAGRVVRVPKRKRCLRVRLIGPLRFDQKWNRLQRLTGAQIVVAKKQVGNK